MTEASSLRVKEVFSVETFEDLEASLTDGYPMPWLAEILEDETIPEEDRYWFDCRVRALIAQEFHLFFDTNGNRIEIEADNIRYGESYWQEHFIIDPPGSIPVGERNPETNLWNESGFVYNRFGEKTGDLVLIIPTMELSRDGSRAALVASSKNGVPVFGSGYLYILIREKTGSENPNVVALYDTDGNKIWTRYTTGNLKAGVVPSISPDGEYCLVASTDRNTIPWTRYCQLFSIPAGGELSVSTAKLSSKLAWSPDGDYCFNGQDYQSIQDNSDVYSIEEFDTSEQILIDQYCSNDGTLFASTFQRQGSRYTTFELSFNDSVIFRNEVGYTNFVRLSPSGLLAMISPLEYGPLGFPFTIWRIGGEE